MRWPIRACYVQLGLSAITQAPTTKTRSQSLCVLPKQQICHCTCAGKIPNQDNGPQPGAALYENNSSEANMGCGPTMGPKHAHCESTLPSSGSENELPVQPPPKKKKKAASAQEKDAEFKEKYPGMSDEEIRDKQIAGWKANTYMHYDLENLEIAIEDSVVKYKF
ncbi:hypothetical protein K435DRAFT_877243 [Dendrothele bispora CBS 962.96]|uniref:Uncharacterized protein n=1 Tax=Dendrothele bispora (strain CBS 962.96) TaxID=1314807 RepID=A0A4S8KQA1_DENBC|nr:hypothetical protein K435DRAFT_877243 [Dendrothele bispora CBS 962.96]